MSVAGAGHGRDELTRSGRVFAFTMTGGFIFVALIGWWRDVPAVTLAARVLAGISVLAGLLIPSHLEPVRRGWMKLGEAIGRVTTPILMAVVYYLVLTPTGLLRRAFVRRRGPSGSYWHRREPLPDKSRLERQF